MSNAAAPVWMLRVNPLRRQRLADPDMAALLVRLEELERATAALAEEATDDLYRLVPSADGLLRGQLLALRRDIHNDRRPSRAPNDLASGMPDSVARWADHLDRRLACQNEIRRTHDSALARERSTLRELLGGGNYLTTLAQAAPGVYEDTCRYRGREVVDSKDRKAERALIQYLTRAMVRTSPYGRFTAVGLAAPDPAGVAMDAATPATATSHVEVDRPLFDYVIGGLTAGEGAAADPWVALPPTARVSDDRITFFQMGDGSLRQLSTPVTAQTRLLVELLALGPRRLSRLAAHMAGRLGAEVGAAERLLSRAIGLGLLVTVWRADEFVAEPVQQATWDLVPAGADQVLEGLRQFQADLDQLGRGGESAIASRLAARQRLSAGGATLSRWAGRPATLAANEDFILDPLLVDPGAHQPALDDLAAVTEFLCAFDRMHDLRALVAAALVDRFGPGCRVPLVGHAETLVRAVYRAEQALAEQPEAPIGPADGSLAMLAKVRREALLALRRNLADGRWDEVCWLPRDAVELVAGVPDRFRADPASYGLVVQPHGSDLVVNDAYAGHGPMVSRFLHADQVRGGDSLARLRSRLGALHGPEARLLEDRGLYGLSINAHPPVLDDSLDPEAWFGLQLGHDRDTDTVSLLDAGGNPVKVLALGAQLPEIFPYPVRLATWLCSSGRVVLDIPGRLQRLRPAIDRTVAYPRVRIGRVVLSRRRWYPGADFPGAGSSGPDADHLVALTQWRARIGVPAEVMLKSAFEGATSWGSLSAEGPRERFFELRRQSKPQYVDLASAVMARILPRLLERRPRGYIEEALPSLSEGGHALEWMVEVSRAAGAARFDWRPAAP